MSDDLTAPLSKRSARTLYNVAEAWFPEPALDVAPGVVRRIRHAGVGAARATWLLLRALDWQPVVTGRDRRGFCWLPRAERRAILERWETSGPSPRRRALARLRRWVEESRAEALQSSGA